MKTNIRRIYCGDRYQGCGNELTSADLEMGACTQCGLRLEPEPLPLRHQLLLSLQEIQSQREALKCIPKTGAPDASYAAREALNFCAPLKNLIDSTQSGDSAGYHIDQALSMTYDDVARAQVSALISIAISLNRSQSQ